MFIHRCCDLLEDSFSLCFFIIQLTCVCTLAVGGCYVSIYFIILFLEVNFKYKKLIYSIVGWE